jgi:aspartate aminotransferase
MLSLSQRAEGLQASPIRKLMPFAIGAKERGTHVHHLNIGQPDIPTPKPVLDALRGYEPNVIAYAQSQGDPDYLDSLHGYYRGLGIDLPSDGITVTTGGSEAILFAFLSAFNPGDELLVPEPFYTNYNTMAHAVGVTIVPVTTRLEDGFHLPPDDEIKALITPKTRGLLLCHPSNPTGTVYTREELNRVVGIVKEHDLWFIVDEVYREFVFDPAPDHLRSVLELSGLDDRVIVVDSISKRFSMCGARLGALVTRNAAMSEAALKLGQARLSSPKVEQHIATAAHRLPPNYIDDMIGEYRRRRDVVYSALNAMPGVTTVRPEGAFYTIPQLPVDDAEAFATWLLTDFNVDGETVMVAPAAGFYKTPGLGKSEVRIAYVLETAALERSMRILSEALQAYNR